MSRLSSLGHELYERVFHRGAEARSAVPEAMDDTVVTARIPRTDELEVAHDLASIDFDQLAYGEDARIEDSPEALITDDGDLYGVYVTPASDRAQLDDDHAFESGQNWLESLETHAAEGGPLPEREIEIVDDSDVAHPSSDVEDRPVADRGSGGPRGM